MEEINNKLCCCNCFLDEMLKNHLWLNGKPGSCSFCGLQNEYCLKPSELREVFQPLIEL